MDCAEVREQFSALLDGELSPEDRAAVEAHLAGCATCLRELNALKQIDGLYRGMKPAAAPADFEERVRDAVRGSVVQFRRRRARTYRLWPMLAAAALFAVVIGTFMVGDFTEEGRFDLAKETSPTQNMKGERSVVSPFVYEEAADQLSPPEPEAAGAAKSEEIGQPTEAPKLEAVGFLDDESVPESRAVEAEKAPATRASSRPALAPPPRPETTAVVLRQKVKESRADTPAEGVTAGRVLAEADSAWSRDINGSEEPTEAESMSVYVEAAKAEPSDNLAPGEAKGSGAALDKDAGRRFSRGPEPAGVRAPKSEPKREPRPMSHPAEELKALGYLGDATPKPSPPRAMPPSAPLPVEFSPPSPARPVHAEALAAPVTVTAPQVVEESADARREAPTQREKTAAGRVFTRRDDGVWVEDGYAGEQVTVLDRDGEILRELLGDEIQAKAILGVGARVVVRIGKAWYHIKPREKN